MAHIAEDLLLLLLDNSAARPALDDATRHRLLAAAVLLDLAYTCRIRPAEPSDAVSADRLMVLTGPPPAEPALRWALAILARKPLSIGIALHKLGKQVETVLFDQLEQTGLVVTTRLHTGGIRRRYAWTLTDRTRPARDRAAVLAALTSTGTPSAPVAAVITLLTGAGALGALLSFDPPGWQRVLYRAGEIASGAWVSAAAPLSEVNLAVTAAALRPALAG